jgi:hypothetical protein
MTPEILNSSTLLSDPVSAKDENYIELVLKQAEAFQISGQVNKY